MEWLSNEVRGEQLVLLLSCHGLLKLRRSLPLLGTQVHLTKLLVQRIRVLGWRLSVGRRGRCTIAGRGSSIAW